MTKIEWTEKSWNPVVGCSVVSPGCTNCYAMRMAARLEAMGVPHYAGLTQQSKAGPVWTGKIALAPEKVLLEPLRRKKPTTYFVNSMGDLFHEDIPDEWIDRVFAVMALAPQHTFQVLTKRAERMRAYMNRQCERGRWPAMDYAALMAATGQWNIPALDLRDGWPLPNVWLGVSCEDQRRADERIPDLLATPAAVHFVSAEPLLGPVDFRRIAYEDGFFDALCGGHFFESRGKRAGVDGPNLGLLDWVIVGGESGRDARPMHPDWARTIRDQCNAAGVPFFFKQWGECIGGDPDGRGWFIYQDRSWSPNCDHRFDDGHAALRVGKKAAGRLLDEREWNEMPGAERRAAA